jgi:hypothetical protein
MRLNDQNTVANGFLLAALLALGYGGWRILTREGMVFDPASAMLTVMAAMTLALIWCLFRRFTAKLSLAIATLALLVGVGVVVEMFHDADISLVRSGQAPARGARIGGPLAMTMRSAVAPGSVQVVYTSVGRITTPLPPDEEKAGPGDGAAFLGDSFTPENPTAQLRLHVTANAYCEAANEVVLAVFRAGESRPLKLISKPVAAGATVLFDETFDVPAGGGGTASFDVRMGPAEAGTIIINHRGGNAPAPALTISEVKP